MKSKILLFACLSFFMNELIFAQNQNDLVGKWIYKDLRVVDEVDDEKGLNMFKQMMKDAFIILKNDGSYIAEMMAPPEKGEWDFEENFLILKNDKGIENKQPIVDLNEEQLVLDLQKFQIVFTKTEISAEEFTKFKRAPQLKKVATTKAAISGKWQIDKLVNKNKMTSTLPEGIDYKNQGFYFNLKANGKYKTKVILDVKEKGNWLLSEDKTELILTNKDGTKSNWSIIKIDENELVLKRGRAGNTIYFSK